MKKSSIALGLSLAIGLGAQSLWASNVEEGAALFQAKCTACHITTRPTDFSKLVAPPAMGIAMHVKMAHPQKEAFERFVVDYVQHPSADKALCMQRTVKRFGIMPSQKGNVTPEELQKIADYLYATFAKGGDLRRKHQRMQRRMQGGGQGMGHGQGM